MCFGVLDALFAVFESVLSKALDYGVAEHSSALDSSSGTVRVWVLITLIHP